MNRAIAGRIRTRRVGKRMRSLFLGLLLVACTASADRSAAPGPAATTPVTTPASSAPKLAASFDTALLCTDIDATGKLLGDPTFGTTESDPPAPSKVGAVVYRFGNEPRLLVAGMSADLPALGKIHFAGHEIAADASMDAIAAMNLEGCGALQHLDGGDAIECAVGDVQVTFARGPVAVAQVQVSARHAGCR